MKEAYDSRNVSKSKVWYLYFFILMYYKICSSGNNIIGMKVVDAMSVEANELPYCTSQLILIKSLR